MRKLYLVVAALLFFIPVFSQLYKVENREKEQNSTLIVEGKVVEQTSFWNPQHTMIFTASKIQVYKVFKGEITADNIEVITQGGSVGDMSIHASDLLELDKGQLGVFFCFPNSFDLKSPVTGKHLYDVYASSQGYFKYGIASNTVTDPFNKYTGITDVFYSMLTTLTGKSFTVIDPSFDVAAIRNNMFTQKTNASIIDFTPATVNAGAYLDPATNVLTINGTGFGNLTAATAGSAAVLFADGNDGGASWYVVALSSAPEFISWTDTQIKLRVPTRASSGTFKIRGTTGTDIAFSPTSLDVNYSILTFNSKQFNLVNVNGSGGYTMLYSTNMTAEATTTFDRALKTWKEVVGANISQGGSVAIFSPTADNQCVVSLDPSGLLGAGVLGVCYSYSNGSCGINYDTRRVEFDVVLRSSNSVGTANFSYGPCAPASNQIDLETVILHELGHGLNLGHINDGPLGAAPNANPPKLMHYAVSNGVKRVSPDYSSYRGALYAVNGVAANYGPCTAQTNMIPLTAITDARDEVPASFPAVPTAGGVTIPVDLAHATSNKKNDPPYNIILCTPMPLGTNITNNVYIPLRTSVTGGDLVLAITDFQLSPASSGVECTGGNAPTMRLALFETPTIPTSPGSYGDPVACRTFTGNGALSTITGLQPNTTYLLYVDGKANAKATFKITLNGTALPIKFEHFTGESKKDHNLLRWMIASFNDVDRLVLQRSGNGIEFTNLHEQKTFEVAKEYSFADHEPLAGKNYYRLAVYNKNGSIQYSTVVILNSEKKIDVNIYPNPVKDRLNISISTAESLKDVQVKLFNSVGQLMIIKRQHVVTGSNNIELNTSGLAGGVYKLQLLDSKGNIIAGVTLQK